MLLCPHRLFLAALNKNEGNRHRSRWTLQHARANALVQAENETHAFVRGSVAQLRDFPCALTRKGDDVGEWQTEREREKRERKSCGGERARPWHAQEGSELSVCVRAASSAARPLACPQAAGTQRIAVASRSVQAQHTTSHTTAESTTGVPLCTRRPLTPVLRRLRFSRRRQEL